MDENPRQPQIRDQLQDAEGGGIEEIITDADGGGIAPANLAWNPLRCLTKISIVCNYIKGLAEDSGEWLYKLIDGGPLPDSEEDKREEAKYWSTLALPFVCGTPVGIVVAAGHKATLAAADNTALVALDVLIVTLSVIFALCLWLVILCRPRFRGVAVITRSLKISRTCGCIVMWFLLPVAIGGTMAVFFLTPEAPESQRRREGGKGRRGPAPPPEP